MAKGIILAGGMGSRLMPLTKLTNKHLLPIFDRAMIEYPLNTLRKAGIRKILIVAGREHTPDFIEYLGSGNDYGVDFTFKVQDEAGGIAQALSLAEDFADRRPITVILGDNIFEDNISQFVKNFRTGARIFLKKVLDPQRFGVPILGSTDSRGPAHANALAGRLHTDRRGQSSKKVLGIIEKPKEPPTPYAVTGLYQYDAEVFKIIKRLKPSARDELEITDVNNAYIKRGQMRAEFVRGFWSDAGTFDSLARTTWWIMNKKLGKKAKMR